MSDVDALNQDVQMIKRFLDAHTGGDWRDPAKWRAGYGAGPLGSNAPTEHFRTRGDRGAAMVVDEDQTRRDRIALGLDREEGDGYEKDDGIQKGTGEFSGQQGAPGEGTQETGTGGGENQQEDPPQG